MLNEMFIAKTAISSFNNAALFGAYFFAIGLLCLPLFYMVYLHGRDILSWLKWNNRDIVRKTSFFSVLFLTVWMLIFGGNYAVIRDGISLLPFLNAIVLFVSVIYITKQSKLNGYIGILNDKKTRRIVFALLILFTICSAMPNLYGILLQLSAVLCGIIVGSRSYKNISDVFITCLIFGMMTILILMQPEFFRFGQLGNLTIIHLAMLLLTGFFATTALVTKYTNSRSKIYESAYIKLKWFFRIISILALVLFVLTESVPVFIGLLGAISISSMLTIYHAKRISDAVSKYSWALMLVCFGVLIICPVITCLGILYITNLGANIKLKDFTGLL